MSRDQFLDHIVIDEGQDLSPLQYHTLTKHQRAHSLTIVGDVAQGIFAYRGLEAWQALEEIYGEGVTYLDVTQNYRSTEEIVAFTNRVMHTIWGGMRTPAKPFARKGKAVPVSGFGTRDAMLEAVQSRLQEVRSSGVENIALILKDERAGRKLSQRLKDLGFDNTYLAADDRTYQGGLAVLTPAVAKGLEFPIVLVLDVDELSYHPGNPVDGALLYVALTRALHHLEVMFVGAPSLFLAEVFTVAAPKLEESHSDVLHEPRTTTQPAPFRSFESRGGTNPNFDTQDGSKGFGQMFRDNGRFGSFPLHDSYDDESDAS